ncbi:MAG: hypothetical protein EA405_07835 [Rhodospirillales bacterium]|nr:MAG: hypothetical protein EA405_07835 [Rhodospirillales bacterium]
MAKLGARQERFCRQFVECANAAAAARAAGYSDRSSRLAGYRLLRMPRVAERIAQLQQETARSHCRDLDVLLGKLEAVFRQSCEDHQFHVAIRAVELQAKLAGMAPPRTPPALRSPLPRPSNDNDSNHNASNHQD